MMISGACKEPSMVLAELESSGTDIEHAGVDGNFTESRAEVTAELAVGVPILPDSSTSDRGSTTVLPGEDVRRMGTTGH